MRSALPYIPSMITLELIVRITKRLAYADAGTLLQPQQYVTVRDHADQLAWYCDGRVWGAKHEAACRGICWISGDPA